MIKLYNGDCLIESDKIQSGRVDLILTDLPYGVVKDIRSSPASKTTGLQVCEWDVVIPRCFKRKIRRYNNIKTRKQTIKNRVIMWWIYALLSALFAALTALLAKVGIKGINSDLATAIRTIFILVIACGIVLAVKSALFFCA